MAGFDREAISVVEPGHKNYDDMDLIEGGARGSRHASTLFYNEVVAAYNKASVGSILLIPIPEGMKFYNIRNVLNNRGLTLNEDYYIERQMMAPDGTILPRSQRPAKIKRLSKNTGRLVDSSS